MKRNQPPDPWSSPRREGDAAASPAPERVRRLALVPGEAAADDAVTPASDEELRQARALAGAIERGEDPLALALRAAIRPPELREADHEALLARAFGDDAAPTTEVEQRAADRLRDALELGSMRRGSSSVEAAPGQGAQRGSHPRGELAELAGALRAAWRPAPLPELLDRALIERALQRPIARRSRRIAPVTMAALSTLAAVAAAAALFVGDAREASQRSAAVHAPESAPPSSRIRARSTAALFDPATPFPRERGQTERIDRITAARAAELRANRYAAWGVR
jgi:hypothetical protein